MNRTTLLRTLLCGILALMLVLSACSGAASDVDAQPSENDTPSATAAGTDDTNAGDPSAATAADDPASTEDSASGDSTDPAAPIQSEHGIPMYNEGGTPTIPQSDPNDGSFDLPGFTPLEKVTLGDIGNDLSVAAVGLYSGSYFEDGSGDEVSNVIAAVVENTGDSIVELCELSVPMNGETIHFKLAALPPHSYCLALSTERRFGRTDSVLPYFTVDSYAPLRNAEVDYSDDFEVYPVDGVINVKNVSGFDISDDIYLIYKNFTNNVYYGGIAYRATYAGGLKDGAVGQSIQRNFKSATAAILYMVYNHD